MIILCIVHLGKKSNDPSTHVHPPVFHFQSLPALFGICVYSFVCIFHPSIPPRIILISIDVSSFNSKYNCPDT